MAPVDRTKRKSTKKVIEPVVQPEPKTASFDLSEISSIVELIRANGISEFRLERGADRLFLRRELELRRPAREVVRTAPIASKVPGDVGLSAAGEADQADLQLETEPKRGEAAISLSESQASLIEIKSPMVGTFYRRPSVDADPYVQVGDIVKKGSVLCIVEAMKLMNEIQSTSAGQIAEVCLEDGQMVEYGEVLFRLRPSA